MGENSSISWTDHTHNEWIGCQRVSPGCGGANGVGGCYAQVSAPVRIQRSKGVELWGPPATAQRMRTSEHNRKQPFAWNRKAEKLGTRFRVFCSSLSDVFEDHPDVHEWRKELFVTIEQTPHLDWQLLTKRPENLRRMLPQAWLDKPRANVWLGTTVEDQRRANERIPHLLATPAVVRFLSCEPLLESVDLSAFEVRADHHSRDALSKRNGRWGTCAACPRVEGAVFPEQCEFTSRYDHQLQPPGIHWLIAGGESGPGARRFEAGWARSIVRQCDDAGVACFVKQMGAFVVDRNDAGFEAELETPPEPSAWPSPVEVIENINGYREQYQGADVRVRLKDRAGADPAEWPADLRIQQFPEVIRG